MQKIMRIKLNLGLARIQKEAGERRDFLPNKQKAATVFMEDLLHELFVTHFGEPVEAVTPLKGGGSDRKLFRLRHAQRSVIGVTNSDRQENLAFLGFSKHFRRAGLPVPEI